MIKKSEIDEIAPLAVSLMPTGIDKLLTREEIRDLMTYLLTEQAPPQPKPQ